MISLKAFLDHDRKCSSSTNTKSSLCKRSFRIKRLSSSSNLQLLSAPSTKLKQPACSDLPQAPRHKTNFYYLTPNRPQIHLRPTNCPEVQGRDPDQHTDQDTWFFAQETAERDGESWFHHIIQEQDGDECVCVLGRSKRTREKYAACGSEVRFLRGSELSRGEGPT